MAEDVAVAHGRVSSERGCCLKDQRGVGARRAGWEWGVEWTLTNLEAARRFLVWGDEYEFRVDPTRVIADVQARLPTLGLRRLGLLRCSPGCVGMAGRLRAAVRR